MKPIILASSSKARQELLKKLQLPFQVIAPNIDETPFENEPANNYVARLAKEKALTVASKITAGVIISGDQTVVIDGKIHNKPENLKSAKSLLLKQNGKSIDYITGIGVYDVASNHCLIEVVPTTIKFRNLSEAEIDSYLERENPINCAGAFHSEGLGIALCEELISSDPTTIIGISLIKVVGMLKQVGIKVI